ncbi:hypothetical protein DBV15_07745, partial [Temnothorax longispinosus]
FCLSKCITFFRNPNTQWSVRRKVTYCLGYRSPGTGTSGSDTSSKAISKLHSGDILPYGAAMVGSASGIVIGVARRLELLDRFYEAGEKEWEENKVQAVHDEINDVKGVREIGQAKVNKAEIEVNSRWEITGRRVTKRGRTDARAHRQWR